MPQYNTKSKVDEGCNIYRNQYKETAKHFSVTKHLLCIWGGSCLKLIRHHILIWIVLYTLLSLLYRYVLYDCTNPRHRELFELLCIYAERFSGLVPITFITGFYVSNVVTRWWDQFMSLPWPDTLAMKLATNIPNGTVRFRTIFFLSQHVGCRSLCINKLVDLSTTKASFNCRMTTIEI